VLDYVEEGKLSLSQARALLAIEGEDRLMETAEKAVEKELTVREIEALSKKPAAAKPKKDERVAEDGVDYVGEVEKRLSNSLGRRVRIAYGKKKGKIELEYYGEEDFETICAALAAIGKTGEK